MPVTKTAKRALAASKRKEVVNNRVRTNLKAAIRIAKRDKTRKNILTAISTVDRAAKRHVIHKNKAARLKSTLSKLLPPGKQKSRARKKSTKTPRKR